MNFGERLIELRKSAGYTTRNEFANKLGIPSTTLRNYETNVREPGHTFLKQISEFFNVSVDYLLCLSDDKDVLSTFRITTHEQSVITRYRNLDDHGRKIVDYILEEEQNRCDGDYMQTINSKDDADKYYETIKGLSKTPADEIVK